MTGDNKTGAREFWIRHESILPGYGCKEKHAYESEQSNSCHVIEYSAFEQRGQELLKANLANQKLQDRVAELEKGILVFNAAAAQDEVEIDSLHLRWTDLKSNYAELLEQANKLEEALSLAGHLEEPEHFNSDRTYGYLMACEDVIEKAKPILTQFAEWKNKNK